MSVLCEAAAPFLAHSAVEGSALARPFTPHVASCLRCQARHAAMTRTAREMRALANASEDAPLDLEWRILSSLEDDLAVARSWRRPLAVAAAIISMAAAIVIWKMRPRTL